MNQIITVLLDHIELDENNHRYLATNSQRAALQTILDDQKVKLVNLAQDIVMHGLNPAEAVILIPHTDYEDKYIVVEGNRRIAALKILKNPSLLNEVQVSATISNAISKASTSLSKHFTTPIKLSCCLIPNRNAADIWIERKHSGEMKGVGTVTWSASQKRQFESKRGTPKIDQQAIEFLQAKELIDNGEVAEIATSTLRRILSDPDIRNAIGLDRENGRLYQKYPDAQVVKGLMRIVNDLLGKDTERGRKLNVDDVRNKADRERYIKNFDSSNLPDPNTLFDQKYVLGHDVQKNQELVTNSESAESDGSNNTATSTTGGSSSTTAHSRKKLLPHDQKLNIGNQTPRLKTIFAELKRIDIDKFTNAAGVLLRVFIEISCDKYGENNGLLGNDLRSNDPQNAKFGFKERAPLDHKMKVVARDLHQKEQLTRKELEAIETVLSDQGNPFISVDLLHTYVHSGAYSPSPRELKDFWDNLQSMIVAIWS